MLAVGDRPAVVDHGAAGARRDTTHRADLDDQIGLDDPLGLEVLQFRKGHRRVDRDQPVDVIAMTCCAPACDRNHPSIPPLVVLPDQITLSATTNRATVVTAMAT